MNGAYVCNLGHEECAIDRSRFCTMPTAAPTDRSDAFWHKIALRRIDELGHALDHLEAGHPSREHLWTRLEYWQSVANRIEGNTHR